MIYKNACNNELRDGSQFLVLSSQRTVDGMLLWLPTLHGKEYREEWGTHVHAAAAM